MFNNPILVLTISATGSSGVTLIAIGEIFDSFREITLNYSHSEKLALFHDNAAKFYQL